MFPTKTSHDLANIRVMDTESLAKQSLITARFCETANFQNVSFGKLRASVFLAFVVTTIPLAVFTILFGKTPSKIVGTVVRPAIIPMKHPMFWAWRGAVERETHKYLDKDCAPLLLLAV